MIPIVELVRLEESGEGTFGVLKINKRVFCCTLEPTDQLNKINVSSIPVQQYICDKHDSPKFGITFQVRDVPGRTDILFHPGNVVGETTGCILLGQYFDKLSRYRGVRNSGETFIKFIKIMGDRLDFHLTIREEY